METKIDLSELSYDKCLLVKENGEHIFLEYKKEYNSDFKQLENFMKKNLECDLFQMVPDRERDIEIYIDDCGKINGKSKLNVKATKLFDMSRMLHDPGLFGNVLFTKSGTVS